MFEYVHKLLYTKCYHSECRQKKSLFDRIFFDLFYLFLVSYFYKIYVKKKKK